MQSTGDPLTDALTATALLLGAAVLLMWAVRLALAALGRIPGRMGRAARSAARAVRPGVARRVTAVVLGLGVPVAASAAPALAAPAPAVSAGASAPCGIAHLAAAPQTLVAPALPRRYVVRPGDTLWDIARRHLSPDATAAEIARAWPRWYAANRRLVGPDPSLITPGMRLRIPGRRSAGTSTASHHRPSPAPGTSAALARSLDPDRR
jgi:hypothetical protein